MEAKTKANFEQLAVSLTSLVILIFLTFQVYTATGFRNILPNRRYISLVKKQLNPPKAPALWPFLNYPMYSYAKFEGDTIDQYFVYGTLEDSTEVPILAEDLGLDLWLFLGHFVDALRRDNFEKIKSFAELYESRHTKKLIGLRLENHPLVFSKEGVNPGSPQILKNIQLEKLEDKQ